MEITISINPLCDDERESKEPLMMLYHNKDCTVDGVVMVGTISTKLLPLLFCASEFFTRRQGGNHSSAAQSSVLVLLMGSATEVRRSSFRFFFVGPDFFPSNFPQKRPFTAHFLPCVHGRLRFSHIHTYIHTYIYMYIHNTYISPFFSPPPSPPLPYLHHTNFPFGRKHIAYWVIPRLLYENSTTNGLRVILQDTVHY